jgi:hypothetical protein
LISLLLPLVASCRMAYKPTLDRGTSCPLPHLTRQRSAKSTPGSLVDSGIVTDAR